MTTTTDQRDELAKALKEALRLLNRAKTPQSKDSFSVLKYDIQRFIDEWKE